MVKRSELAGGTGEQILDAAERRVQVVGFNGISYADIAREIGVTNATIHYHFPAKVDLGVRLVERYSERFFAAVSEIDAKSPATRERLNAYVELYQGVLAADRLCLCGIMASESETLAPPIRMELMKFFRRNEEWLGGQLEAGRMAGEIHFSGAPDAVAIAVIGALEGAMLVARVHDGLQSFQRSTRIILAALYRAPT